MSSILTKEHIENLKRAEASKIKLIFATNGIVHTCVSVGEIDPLEKCILSSLYDNPQLLKWFDEMVQIVKKEKLKIIPG